MDSPFDLHDIVETHKGARFWGEVVSTYSVPVSRPGEQPTEEWRCDVRAIAPDFEGTIHVYPASQLRLRTPPPGGGVTETDEEAYYASGVHEPHSEPPALSTRGEKPAREWRCFHCGEIFRTHEDALAHFGDHEGREPACLIDSKRVREMEIELDRYHAEDSDKDRELIAMAFRHADALRREEEKGYARALRDVGYAETIEAAQRIAHEEAQRLFGGELSFTFVRSVVEKYHYALSLGRRRFRHNKHGSEYVLWGFAKMQSEDWLKPVPFTRLGITDKVDMQEVAVYLSLDDASLWVRPKEEFFDGRFTEIKDGVDKMT